MYVDYPKYKLQSLTCSKFDWHGKGEELVNVDFSELNEK